MPRGSERNPTEFPPVEVAARKLLMGRMAEILTLHASLNPMAWDMIETHCMEMAHAAERTAAALRLPGLAETIQRQEDGPQAGAVQGVLSIEGEGWCLRFKPRSSHE